MASSESYNNLRQAISETVTLLYNKGPSNSLKASFESGGEIHAILQTLEEKKKRISEHQKNIDSLEIASEETINLANQNKLELAEIDGIQSKLNSLSTKLVEPTGAVTMQGIVDNFVKSLASNQEVKQGFFTTLFNTITRAFSAVDTASIQNAKDNLNNFKDILEKEPKDRYKIPNEKEIELAKSKELQGQKLDVSQVKNNTIDKKTPKSDNKLEELNFAEEVKENNKSLDQREQDHRSKIRAGVQGILNDDDATKKIDSSSKALIKPDVAIEELAELFDQGDALELKKLLASISKAQQSFAAEYDSETPDADALIKLQEGIDKSTDELYNILENLDKVVIDIVRETKILDQIDKFNSFAEDIINAEDVEFTRPFDFTVIENHLEQEQNLDITSDIKTENQNQEIQNGAEKKLDLEQTVNKQQPKDLLSEIRERGGKVLSDDEIPPAPPLKDEEIDEIPPAPPLKDEINDKKPVENKQKPKDLLSEIRERGGKVTPRVSLDQGNFKYVLLNTQNKEPESNSLLNVMNNLIDNEEKKSLAEELLDGKSKGEQLNVLYSAMVDNNQALTKDLLNHTTSVKTGTTVDEDGWDVDIIEKTKLFSIEDVEKVGDAVVITQNRQNGIATAVKKETSQQQNITNIKEFSLNKETTQQSPIVNKENALTNDEKNPSPATLKENTFQNKIQEDRFAGTQNLNKKTSSSNFLESIRQGVTLKKVENSAKAVGNLNMDGFTYEASKEKPNDQINPLQAALANKFKQTIDYDDLLGDMTEKQQLDFLYTAVINGQQDKIEGVIEYAEDNDLSFIKKENMQKLYDAAMKVASEQPSPKKIIIEKGCKVISEEMGLKVSQSQSIKR